MCTTIASSIGWYTTAHDRTEATVPKDRAEPPVSPMTDELERLRQVNAQLGARVETINRVSVQYDDPVIRKVDHTVGKVWIKAGTADGLTVGTRFLVYDKMHHGAGRFADDVKGMVEVTRVLGPHIAETRIVDEDINRPFTTNDPVSQLPDGVLRAISSPSQFFGKPYGGGIPARDGGAN